jgi:hypothetical protein
MSRQASNGSPRGRGRGLAIAAVIAGLVGLPLLIDLSAPEPGFSPKSARGLFLAVVASALAIASLIRGRRIRVTRWIATFGLLLGCAACVGYCSVFERWRTRIGVRESATIGSIRELIRIERAFAESNGGVYLAIECLSPAGGCAPATGVSVFTHRETSLDYRYTFHAGPPADRPASGGTRGLSSFAYVAVPLRPGVTGVRAFCGDDTGEIRVTMDAAQAMVVDGRCDRSLARLP